MSAALHSARSRARTQLPSSWFLFITLLLICQYSCSPAPLPSLSSTMDHKHRTTLTNSSLSSSAAPDDPAPSNPVTVKDSNMATQPFLPVPTAVELLIVNATVVRVQWSFDYSGIRPPTLRPALSFAVEVTALGRHTEVEAVPGDRLHLLFTEVVKLVEYRFRVTAQSGDTTSQPSQPSDTLLGGVPSCTLPTNLRVTAVQVFNVSLAWDQSTCEEYVTDPLYFIKFGSSPEEVDSAQSSLFTSGLSLTVPILPGRDYYFCVGVQYLLPSVCSARAHAATPSVELPQLAVPKISGGLRSVTITWTPPPLTTSGVAVYQYNLYYMPGPASAFSQRRAQRLPVKPLKGTQATLPNLEPVVEYSVAVTYVVVKRGREPTYWEQESAPSPVAIARSAPDAQSFSVQCSQCKALSPELLRIFWQVEPSVKGQSNLHMTLHISDLLAHRQVGSSEEWTGGHFDVGGLAPWSTHQYGLQLEDQLGYKGKNFTCQPCRTLEEAPSAAPSSLSVRPSGQSYYASWEGLSEEQQNGRLEYQVLLYQCATGTNNTHLSDADCGRCVQRAVHTTLTTPLTSISLREATHLDTAYAVQVRGITGQGSLKGPLSPPSCFTTPEGAPNQAPAVHYNVVLGQAVCVEWDVLVRGLQFGEVLGYLVAVSEGPPAGDPATFHQHETNVTDLHYLLSDLREGMAYNITVRAYNLAGSGPPSDRVMVRPTQLERSKTDMGLKATHDTSDACSTVTISWARQQDACGSYANVLEYYVANDSSTLRAIPVPPNTTYVKLMAKEFSPETEYEFRLKASYTGLSGHTVQETTSDPANIYIPYCRQVLDYALITVLGTLLAIMVVTIFGTLLTLLCCHYRCMRLSRRRLRNTPRYHQRMRRRQNPYVQYPEGSPHLTTSATSSMLSDGSDMDDLPLRLSPSPQHELGGYVSLPLNNTQLDSLTRSLSPIAMRDIRRLVDKEKSPPPSAGPLSAAGSGKGPLQKRRRPIGQSDTTVYGDSSSSDSDSDNNSDTSDNSLLQT